MQSDRFLLTFAIPTFNRSKHLAQLLSDLLPQLANESRVELIISDNASSDDTPTVVEEFQRKGLHISYIRNETNIGADANFLQCFRRGRGTYVWLFGDDDTLIPGTMPKIIRLLEAGNFDLVYLTPYGYTRMEQLRQIPILEWEPAVYTSAIQYVRRVNNMFTFISSNIINKARLATASDGDYDCYVGTNLIQLSWTYAALNNFRSALFIPQVTVISLSDNSGGFGICRVMGVNLSTLARRIVKRPRIVQILENATLRECLPFYLVKMKESTYTLNQEPAHEILSSQFRSNRLYWLFPYPIIKLPLVLARKWLVICRILAKLHKVAFIMLPEKIHTAAGSERREDLTRLVKNES